MELAEFITSSKGGKLLKRGQFLMRIDRKTPASDYYKCTVGICKARSLVDSNGYVTDRNSEHFHTK